jgi:hypothetical protein
MQPVTPSLSLHAIVEGEPGIFPAPVARVMQKIGGFFDRRRKPEAGPEPEPSSSPSSPSSSSSSPSSSSEDDTPEPAPGEDTSPRDERPETT